MRNDEPSSRRRKKKAAQTQGAEVIELKTRRRPQAQAPAAEPLDSDFGLALCLMPRSRRRLPEA